MAKTRRAHTGRGEVRVVAELKEGSKAPQFTLPAVNLDRIGMSGEEVALKEFAGEKIVVLYFYPRDNTSGCTVEAVGFRDLKGQFTRNGAVILGVSTDDLDTHRKFIEKQKLNFPLLTDEGGKIAQKYGVWKEKKMYGKTVVGMARSTFVIGKDGKIARIWPKVSPEGHAAEVLDVVKSMA
jgi:peroxiredoxin Q/BCP